MSECRYAYRVSGDVSVHCRVLQEKGARHDYCVHQYLCNRTKRWETSKDDRSCETSRQAAR